MPDNNLFPEKPAVTKSMREERNGHRAVLLWFTGLSGAGKTALSQALCSRLFDSGLSVYSLDGDNIRDGLSGDLGFGLGDRSENIRRIGEVGRLFCDAGFITTASFISPLRADRDRVRRLLGTGNFIEIWVRCPLECCEKRDVKGLYRRARSGGISDFTGIDSPYEPPLEPELIIDSEKYGIDECVGQIILFLEKEGIINESA